MNVVKYYAIVQFYLAEKLLTLTASGKWVKSVLTMETKPPRIAAYSGVHLVLL